MAYTEPDDKSPKTPPLTIEDVKACIDQVLAAAGFPTVSDVKACIGDVLSSGDYQTANDVLAAITSAINQLNFPTLAEVKQCIQDGTSSFVSLQEVKGCITDLTSEHINELEAKGIVSDCIKANDFLSATEIKALIQACIEALGLQPAALNDNGDGTATFVGKDSDGSNIEKKLQCGIDFVSVPDGGTTPPGNGTIQILSDSGGMLTSIVLPGGAVIEIGEERFNVNQYNTVGIVYDPDSPPADPAKPPGLTQGMTLRQCFANGVRVYQCNNGALINRGFKPSSDQATLAVDSETGFATYVGTAPDGSSVTKDLQCGVTFITTAIGATPPDGNGSIQIVSNPLGVVTSIVKADGTVVTIPDDRYDITTFNNANTDYDPASPPAAPAKPSGLKELAVLNQCFKNGTRVYRCENGVLVNRGFKGSEPAKALDWAGNDVDLLTAELIYASQLRGDKMGFNVPFIADPADATGCKPLDLIDCPASFRATTINDRGDTWYWDGTSWSLKAISPCHRRFIANGVLPTLTDADLAALPNGFSFVDLENGDSELCLEITNDDCVPWTLNAYSRAIHKANLVAGNRFQVFWNDSLGGLFGGSGSETYDTACDSEINPAVPCARAVGGDSVTNNLAAQVKLNPGQTKKFAFKYRVQKLEHTSDPENSFNRGAVSIVADVHRSFC
jgi:hypothetical protein